MRDPAALRAMARVILQFPRKRLDPAYPLARGAHAEPGAGAHRAGPGRARGHHHRGPEIFEPTRRRSEQLEKPRGSLSPEATALPARSGTGGHRNIIISGGTGTGKTTLLGILARMIEPAERILTIEDVAELDLRMPHVVPVEARCQTARAGAHEIRELFRAALRMRPTRIRVGECRGGESARHDPGDGTRVHAGWLSTPLPTTPPARLPGLETNLLS